MTHNPAQWWPFTASGVHVRHIGCGGWLYHQYDEALNITATACDRCNPGFQEVQLNMFDYFDGKDVNDRRTTQGTA